MPNHPITRRASVIAMLLVPAHVALGQAVPKPPEKKPALPPIVTVTKTDGATLKGALLASSPDNITLRPSPAKPADKPEPLTLKWSEIKSISNGLTREKAVAAWKDEHKDELCAECRGDRTLTCATCKGTGHAAESSKDCPTCKGTQTVKCTTPKCEAGKLPCPQPCIKLSEGKWVVVDGTRWREFPKKNGGFNRWSEGHVGELVQRDNIGDPVGTIACPTCNKTGKVNDPACRGTALAACPRCKADPKAADCPDCDAGQSKCKACDGAGLTKKPAA